MTREIKAYNQGTDARWYAGEVQPGLVGKGASRPEDFVATDTSNGVCFGLSIWWIIKKSKEIEDFKKDPVNASKEIFWEWMLGPGPQVTEIKNLFRSQKGDDYVRFDEANKKITGETALKKQCEILVNEGTKFDMPGYYYISLRGTFGTSTDSSGHAIAVYINPDSKGKCYYFDPNFGEYETDSVKELLEELKNLIIKYKIKDLKIYWCCWGITAT